MLTTSKSVLGYIFISPPGRQNQRSWTWVLLQRPRRAKYRTWVKASKTTWNLTSPILTPCRLACWVFPASKYLCPLQSLALPSLQLWLTFLLAPRQDPSVLSCTTESYDSLCIQPLPRPFLTKDYKFSYLSSRHALELLPCLALLLFYFCPCSIFFSGLSLVYFFVQTSSLPVFWTIQTSVGLFSLAASLVLFLLSSISAWLTSLSGLY